MLRVPPDGDWYFSLWHGSLRHPVANTPLSEGEPCITTYEINLRARVFLALSVAGQAENTPQNRVGV